MKMISPSYMRQPDGRWQPATHGEATSTFNLTDMGNAERLANHYGDRLRYCYEAKHWLVWTGKVWEWDTGSKVNIFAKQTVRNIYHEAGNAPSEKARKEVADHAPVGGEAVEPRPEGRAGRRQETTAGSSR